jgi:uncharacterized membrane protein YbhN (UPF0104 family)
VDDVSTGIEPGPPTATASRARDTSGDVAVQAWRDVPKSRRAGNVLRLILSSGVILAAVLVANLGDGSVKASERGLLQTIVTLPESFRDAFTVAVQVLFVLLPVAIVATVAVRRRFSLAGRLLLAGAAGTAAGALASHLLLSGSHPPEWPGLLAGSEGVLAVTFPPVAWLSGVTAVVTVAGDDLSRSWRTALWWTTVALAGVEVLVGGFLPVPGGRVDRRGRGVARGPHLRRSADEAVAGRVRGGFADPARQTLLPRQDLGLHPIGRDRDRGGRQEPPPCRPDGRRCSGGPAGPDSRPRLLRPRPRRAAALRAIGAVYLGARLVASAAPTPGGLGALEAAVIAGLSALGMAVGAAASAVLIYRLLTYWLGVPVGWVSLKVAESRGYV